MKCLWSRRKKFTRVEENTMIATIEDELNRIGNNTDCEIDAAVLLTLHREFGFGETRLKRFFNSFIRIIPGMLDMYAMDDNKEDRKWLCAHKLKEETGIDISELNGSSLDFDANLPHVDILKTSAGYTKMEAIEMLNTVVSRYFNIKITDGPTKDYTLRDWIHDVYDADPDTLVEIQYEKLIKDILGDVAKYPKRHNGIVAKPVAMPVAAAALHACTRNACEKMPTIADAANACAMFSEMAAKTPFLGDAPTIRTDDNVDIPLSEIIEEDNLLGGGA